MAHPVTNGAMIRCSFGIAPGSLVVLPLAMVTTGSQPVATIFDNKPLLNILPFGMCNSATNPAVIAARAAALGSPVPGPCLPVVTAPWAPGSPGILVGGKPLLNNTSKCMCAWSGVIEVVTSPAITVMTP